LLFYILFIEKAFSVAKKKRFVCVGHRIFDWLVFFIILSFYRFFLTLFMLDCQNAPGVYFPGFSTPNLNFLQILKKQVFYVFGVLTFLAVSRIRLFLI